MSLHHPVRGTLFSRVAASFISAIPRVMRMTHSWLIRDSFVTHSWLIRVNDFSRHWYVPFVTHSWLIRDSFVTHSGLTYMTFIHDLFMWHTGVYTRSSSNHAPRVVHMTRSWLNPMTHSWLVHMIFTHDSFMWHIGVYTRSSSRQPYDSFVTYSHDSFVTRSYDFHPWLIHVTQLSTRAAAAATLPEFVKATASWMSHKWVARVTNESRMSHERVTTEPYAWVTNESYRTGVYARSSSSRAPRVRDSHSVKLGENHVPPRFFGKIIIDTRMHSHEGVVSLIWMNSVSAGIVIHIHTHEWVVWFVLYRVVKTHAMSYLYR